MGKDTVAANGCSLLLCRGMDVYNKRFLKHATDPFHDSFYTDPDVLAAFSRYVAMIVKRYANETSVFGTFIVNYDGSCTYLISKVGNLPTTPVVPPLFPQRTTANLRPLLNGLRLSQKL
jgi:hypothetical protein